MPRDDDASSRVRAETDAGLEGWETQIAILPGLG